MAVYPNDTAVYPCVCGRCIYVYLPVVYELVIHISQDALCDETGDENGPLFSLFLRLPRTPPLDMPWDETSTKNFSSLTPPPFYWDEHQPLQAHSVASWVHHMVSSPFPLSSSYDE